MSLWLVGSMGAGIKGMGELIIITMMAGGNVRDYRENGGIDYLIKMTTDTSIVSASRANNSFPRKSLVDICTANNTVAILTVGVLQSR